MICWCDAHIRMCITTKAPRFRKSGAVGRVFQSLDRARVGEVAGKEAGKLNKRKKRVAIHEGPNNKKNNKQNNKQSPRKVVSPSTKGPTTTRTTTRTGAECPGVMTAGC